MCLEQFLEHPTFHICTVFLGDFYLSRTVSRNANMIPCFFCIFNHRFYEESLENVPFQTVAHRQRYPDQTSTSRLAVFLSLKKIVQVGPCDAEASKRQNCDTSMHFLPCLSAWPCFGQTAGTDAGQGLKVSQKSTCKKIDPQKSIKFLKSWLNWLSNVVRAMLSDVWLNQRLQSYHAANVGPRPSAIQS